MRNLVLPLILGLAIGLAPASKADVLDDIKSQGKMVVGVEAGGTGAIISKDAASGKIVGLDADINALIAQKLGVELQMVEVEWSGIIPALLGKRFDMILSGMTATEARAKNVSFSTPYGDASLVLASLSADDRIKTPKDISGKLIGVLLGSNAIDFVKSESAKVEADNLPPVKDLKIYESIPAMFIDLGNKRIDGLVLPNPIIGGYFAKRPGEFKIATGFDAKSYFCAAIRKEDTAFIAAVNDILKQLKSDGTLATLQTKWLGAPTSALPDTWMQ
jgi:polar amino acid transport system substrate-binding protein